MLNEEQLMTVIISAKEHFSIPLEPLKRRGAGRPNRSLYYSLFNAAAVNIGRVHTDVGMWRAARTIKEIRPVNSKKRRNRNAVRTIRVFTLSKIGCIAGVTNHSTVKYHFSQHGENIKIQAYYDFFTYMDDMAKSMLSPPPAG